MVPPGVTGAGPDGDPDVAGDALAAADAGADADARADGLLLGPGAGGRRTAKARTAPATPTTAIAPMTAGASGKRERGARTGTGWTGALGRRSDPHFLQKVRSMSFAVPHTGQDISFGPSDEAASPPPSDEDAGAGGVVSGPG